MEANLDDLGGYVPVITSFKSSRNLSFLAMRLRVVLIALLLMAPLTPSISATPPKAGALCSKAGITKNYNGKKYTCIKSGKKLVWNKGVRITVVKPTPTPTPTPTPPPTPTPTPPPTPTPTPTPTQIGRAHV